MQTNCQIIRFGAKLHNYVVNADNLNFRNVIDDDFEALEVDLLNDGPAGNIGYLLKFSEEVIRSVGADVESPSRRQMIVNLVIENELSMLDRNIKRNA